MKKKKRITLSISYALAAMAILGGMVYQKQLELEEYQRRINYTYQHAFIELASSVSEIDTALQKCMYATSPAMTTALCTNIFGNAASAQMALGEIPLDAGSLEQTAAFITRVGDYAYVLSRSASNKDCYTEEELDNLTALSDTAGILSGNLNRLLSQVQQGELTIEELAQVQEILDDTEAQQVEVSLGRSISLVESEFPEIPSLIYDGPFSDHLLQMTPKLIEHETEVTQDQAMAIAAKFLDLKKEIFRYTGNREGNLPTYNFTAKVDGGDLTVEVSRQGGQVVSVLNSRQVAAAPLSAEDGVNIARKFLAGNGYSDMKESYWMISGNKITVNFAYVQDDVICYPDLVKVTVGLDNGRVTGFEALGYIMSHTADREIPQAEISEEDALAMVPERLTVKAHNMAVIPTGGKYEVFCHEFKCVTEDERNYILYVNAVTGQQEDILILIEDDSGTLTL